MRERRGQASCSFTDEFHSGGGSVPAQPSPGRGGLRNAEFVAYGGKTAGS